MTPAILTHLRNAAKACNAGYEVSLSIAEVRQIVAAIDAKDAEIAALKQQADVDGFVAKMKDAPGLPGPEGGA